MKEVEKGLLEGRQLLGPHVQPVPGSLRVAGLEIAAHVPELLQIAEGPVLRVLFPEARVGRADRPRRARRTAPWPGPAGRRASSPLRTPGGSLESTPWPSTEAKPNSLMAFGRRRADELRPFLPGTVRIVSQIDQRNAVPWRGPWPRTLAVLPGRQKSGAPGILGAQESPVEGRGRGAFEPWGPPPLDCSGDLP